MRPTKRLDACLIIVFVAFIALFGCASLFDQDGDRDGFVRTADGLQVSPDHVSSTRSMGTHRLRAVAAARTPNAPPSLPAAVPGGLCLLI